ncbi:MAG: bifunctional diaminohydroxyphosphoribosylaminopyrimidine deaminase/5-amino-6-(5-phosphoribosylamino)uracil reductase RibD [Chthoniobacterales bacterium]
MLPDPTTDAMFMAAALAEARKGVGKTSPNPAVGAVIVADGKILAVGHHRAAGQAHAEIEALRALPDPALAQGATIYITLEPCSSEGRTPPCTAALVRHGLARVVYGATDPNPKHAGRANAILREAGVEVTAGVLSDECSALNESWNHWIRTGNPFVIAKCGMSLDGRISSHPASRWITSAASRRDAMARRASVDAILIGAGTARLDDPKLTIRGMREARQPWRVVWSPGGALPPTLGLFNDKHKERTLVMKHGTLREVLSELGKKDITSVLIEGGGQTLGAAFDEDLVHRIEFYIAPVILGGPVPAVGGVGIGKNCDARKLHHVTYESIGPDLKISALVQTDN